MARPRTPPASSASTIALRVLLAIIGILFAIATISGALADSLAITLPTSVQEGSTVNAAVTGPGTLTILIDNVAVATGTGTVTHALATDHTSAGNRQYRFTTTDTSTANETRTVTIQDVPLTVTVTAPTQTDLNDPTPTFSVTTNWAPELCYVVIDGTDTRTLNPTSTTSFSSDLAVSDGVHTIQYKCKLGAELPSITRTIHVDTVAPIVTASAPSGTQTGSYATLSVTTDEIALCRYGQTDAPYGSLPLAMGGTYATTNQVTLALASGPQTYFIRCADVMGNAMGISHIVSFTAQAAPTATIDIEEQEPLRAGSYKVTLRTSAALASTPTLSYQFQSGSTQQIGLTGSGSSWEGYLLIPENTPGESVTFTFRGTGLDGSVGTQITDGALVRIDAVPPGPIDAIEVTNSTNGITLVWTQRNPEDGIRYKVYRADHEGVTENDEIAAVTDTRYHDTASGSRYYWYRVIAIDEAGNYGPVSDEVYGSAIDPALANSPLDAATLARIDETLLAIDGAITTADTTIDDLTGEPNPSKISIINDMRLIERAQDARSSLEEARAGLVRVRAEAIATEEAILAINSAQDAMRDARTTLIRRIVPDQQVETRQVLEDREITANIAYALTRAPDGTDRDAVLAAAKDARDHVTITLSASAFSLWDWAGVEHQHTFVRKRIALERPLNDVTLIEIVPKTVASDIREISFVKEPIVLEEDPVVAYEFDVLQDEEISYVIDRKVPLDEVKRTRTIAYPKPAAVTAPAGDSVTGFAVFGLGELPGFDTLLLVIGALVIVALGGYYVSLGSEPRPFKGLGQRLTPRDGAIPALAPHEGRRIIAKPMRSMTPAAQAFRKEERRRTLADALEEAERSIDERDYTTALGAYREAITGTLSRESMDEATRTRIGRVYTKLMLHKHLDDASAAIGREDARSSRDALAQAQRCAHDLDGEEPTTLINDAKQAYTTLMRQLNALEIKHAAKY